MEGFCEFRDGGRATTEPLEHLPPCGVGKSLKRSVEVMMVSHLPKYTTPNRLGQYLSDGHATEGRRALHPNLTYVPGSSYLISVGRRE